MLSAFPLALNVATTSLAKASSLAEDERASATSRLARHAPEADPAPTNVWAGIMRPMREDLVDLTPRVYVPDEIGGDIIVIDAASKTIVDRYPVGRTPHHVTPSYDMSRLYVNVMASGWLTEIDINTGQPARRIPVAAPYNLYFSPDGSLAIVAAEMYNRLDFFDPITWHVIARLPIRASGIDHLDFDATGHFLVVSAEFDGQIIKVDLDRMAVERSLRVGGSPIDVKLAPAGDVYFVANQSRHGVSVIDADSLTEIDFIRTGLGAHGLAISRDTNLLYVSNRIAGTITSITFDSHDVVDTWRTGGSPDMLQVSPDGTELWASGRNHAEVYVVDTGTGELVTRMRVGAGPHGLTYFPQPGNFCIGHNGVYR